MTLDNKPALVVIDLQKGVVALPATHPIDEIVQRSASLAAAFRKNDLPVVLVNVDGRAPGRTEAGPSAFSPPADWRELVAELEPQPGDLEVTKRAGGAFHANPLDAQLQEHGVPQVVLTGLATGDRVQPTPRDTHQPNCNVALVTDAMTD